MWAWSINVSPTLSLSRRFLRLLQQSAAAMILPSFPAGGGSSSVALRWPWADMISACPSCRRRQQQVRRLLIPQRPPPDCVLSPSVFSRTASCPTAASSSEAAPLWPPIQIRDESPGAEAAPYGLLIQTGSKSPVLQDQSLG